MQVSDQREASRARGESCFLRGHVFVPFMDENDDNWEK